MTKPYGSTASDPYGDHRPYHLAKRLGPNGEVSPLCAEPNPKALHPRARWTLCDEDVTCAKCLRAIAALAEDKR